MINIKKLILVSALPLAGVASADDPSWPADFWAVFSNRVTTARAAHVTTATSGTTTLDVLFRADADVGSFGDRQAPFDSRFLTILEALGLNFNSFPPTGFLLQIK